MPAGLLMGGMGKPGAMPPPPDDMPPKGPQPPGEKEPGEDENKMDPAKALVSHADENCGNCANYHAEDGSCEEVSGQFDPTDRCWSAYSAASGGEDESEDGSIGPPPDDGGSASNPTGPSAG